MWARLQSGCGLTGRRWTFLVSLRVAAAAAQVVSGTQVSPDTSTPNLVSNPLKGILLKKKKTLLGVTPFKLTSLLFCDLIFP